MDLYPFSHVERKATSQVALLKQIISQLLRTYLRIFKFNQNSIYQMSRAVSKAVPRGALWPDPVSHPNEVCARMQQAPTYKTKLVNGRADKSPRNVFLVHHRGYFKQIKF